VTDFIRELIENFQVIGWQVPYWRLWFTTLLTWSFVYTNFYLIVLSLGFQFSYFQMIVVSVLMIPLTLLPVQGFANLGSHEVGWVLAFSIFNQPMSTSLTLAVSSHIVMLFFALLIGLVGIILIGTGKYFVDQISV
jgi:hypothetical protein